MQDKPTQPKYDLIGLIQTDGKIIQLITPNGAHTEIEADRVTSLTFTRSKLSGKWTFSSNPGL